MASEASSSEQTTDEMTEGSKVIDDAKIVEEDGVSQPEQTAASEIGKDKVEEQASSENSAMDSKEMMENKDEAFAIEGVEKEDKDDTTSASGVLEDKREDEAAIEEVKRETEDSETFGSDVLGDNKDDASVIEDVKKEAATGKTSGISDVEVEASIRDPDEKFISTPESFNEEVEKMLLDSSSSSVLESEQVGCEPVVSKPVVEMAKSTEESLDVSTNPDLESEAVAKSEEHTVAFTFKVPAPDDIQEFERKNETSEADNVMEASKDETVAIVEGETVSELFKEESVVEAGSSLSQPLKNGNSTEVEAKDVDRYSFSENTEKASDDVNADVCPAVAKSEGNEHGATESLGKEVTVDTSLPNPLIAGGTEVVDTTSVTEAADIVVKPEMNIEEQKGENTVEMELVKEQKEEKTMEKEPAEEQDEEKAVETGSTLTTPKETEGSSEEAKPSEDADKVSKQDWGPVSATQPTGNLEKEKTFEVVEELAEEPKHENEDIEDNTAQIQTSSDQIGPTTEVTETSSKEEKSFEGADKVVEQRNLGVSSSAAKSTENLEKVKASEVAEEPKHEKENIEDETTLVQTSRDIYLGEQNNETDKSTREAVVKLEPENSDVDTVEKDETEKKDETDKSVAQDLAESSNDGADSKTNLEVQKAEASGKPSKTLMSKVKHSIVKVKKAIIGKSPSSKTISAESKEELKVK